MSIKLKLGSLIGFFLVLMLGNSLVLKLSIDSAQSHVVGVNIAGKQRMLSQKMAKEAFLIAAGNSDQVSQLSKTIAMYDQGLKSLVEGNSELNLAPITDQKALALIDKISGPWEGYSSQLLNVSQGTSNEQLSTLTAESIDLLKKSNEIVQALEQQVNDETASITKFLAMFVLLAIISSGLGYFYLQKMLIARIEKIKEASRCIVRKHDLNTRIGLQGEDELDQAAQAFDQMLDDFSGMYREVRKVEISLREQVESLTVSAESNRTNMDQQTGEIIQISTSINQMAATVQEIAQNTLYGSNVSKDSLKAANDGNAVLEANISLTNDLANEVREASSNIEKLVEASNSIGGIASTISGIAEQTNLLALNAAIEAARAGEQGRGFAVVADEVRTLAQKTQDATSQIHTLISSLYETTNSSVATMEKSRAHSEESVNKSKIMRSAFNEIITSIRSLSDISHQIAVSTEEQSTVAGEMEKNITRIENKSQVTQEIANATAKSSARLHQMCDQLSHQLSKYNV